MSVSQTEWERERRQSIHKCVCRQLCMCVCVLGCVCMFHAYFCIGFQSITRRIRELDIGFYTGGLLPLHSLLCLPSLSRLVFPVH